MDSLCLYARLTVVARWVIPNKTMADIGTDHAYLPCWLVNTGRCPAAVASDIAEGPFQRAKKVVAEYGLSDRISVRRGSGLSVLRPGEAATIVFAGMGGQLICELLQSGTAIAAAAQRLVLQPQRNPELVRDWLSRSGWRIIADDLAEDGKLWYNIIVAEQGYMNLDEAGMLYGPFTPGISKSLRHRWLSFRRDSLLEIVGKLRALQGPAAVVRVAELEKEISMLDKLIDEVEIC